MSTAWTTELAERWAARLAEPKTSDWWKRPPRGLSNQLARQQRWQLRDLYRLGQPRLGRLMTWRETTSLGGSSHVLADLLLSWDPWFEQSTGRLAVIVSHALELRRRGSVVPGLAEFASSLRGSKRATVCMRLPDVLTEHRVVWLHTTIFVRQHLPGRKLQSLPVPVLAVRPDLPDRPTCCAVMPSGFWPEELRARWEQQARR